MARKYSKKSKKSMSGVTGKRRRNTSKKMRKSRKNMNKSNRVNQRGGVYYTFDESDHIGGLARVVTGSNCPSSRPDSDAYKFELYGQTAQ